MNSATADLTTATGATPEELPAGVYKALPARWFDVHLIGFDIHKLRAVSRSQARYLSWKAAKEAGYYTRRYGGFRSFMRDSWVTVSANQGDPRTPEFGVAP